MDEQDYLIMLSFLRKQESSPITYCRKAIISLDSGFRQNDGAV